MKLKRLSHKDPECWRDWPALRRAIADAAVALGQKTIDPMLDKVLAGFAFEDHQGIPEDKRGSIAVWYVVDDAGAILAHLIAGEDLWDGERVIYVHQLWAPRLRPDLRRLAAEELDHFARARGCQTIMMYTRRDSPKFWGTTFGFSRFRVLYRRVVP
jgi:hypothetical protein